MEMGESVMEPEHYPVDDLGIAHGTKDKGGRFYIQLIHLCKFLGRVNDSLNSF